jgi:Kdo2-lipid IVA lauroyltransferase/acyltransferase
MLRFLEFIAARFFLAMLQALPYAYSLRLARSLARLAFRFDSRPKRRTIEHLRFAYGDSLSPARINEIAQGVFESLMCHAAEAAHIFRRALDRLRVENAEVLKEAYARGRGVVVVSAHMGYFVRMAAIPRLLGVRAAVIMKNQRNDRLLQWGIRELKRRHDLDVILKKKARDLVGADLAAGRIVGFFADQHPRSGGFPTRFFGHDILAATGPTIYAKRFDCPLIVFTAAREADGTHVLHFDGPISTEGSHEEVSQRWLDLLEKRIREHPDQWMWMHRRWRTVAEDRAASDPAG